jgi:tRNA A-37 threonylcarbamoyl transferase component Bud32
MKIRADSIVREVGDVIHKQHRGNAAARARHEFETLRMLREAMPESYTVPRAIQLDEADGSLVMERASGTPLDVTIRANKRQPDAIARLAAPLRRAGEWLRAMQDATHAGDILSREDGEGPPDLHRSRATGRGSFAVSTAQDDSPREILAEQTTTAIGNAEAKLTGRLQRNVVTRLGELQIRVAPRALFACGHHGDYWPGNVFLDEKHATVIDFEGYRLGLPLEDVAYFLIELELLMPRHTRYLPALRAAFLDGYGGVDDAGALQLFTLTKTLHLISRNAGSKLPFLIALWTRRTLRNIVKRCLRQ